MSPTPKPRTENPGSIITFEATLLEGCSPLTTPVTAVDYADGPFALISASCSDSPHRTVLGQWRFNCQVELATH